LVNRLSESNSPYLLQHAENPVDWHTWSEEALLKARKEEKPIFLSIGYSACHWCHVMAHESFEDPQTASIMNEYFVNIKVDREERPDLDEIYMNAIVAMTGQGGWPLSVFLTPSGDPFYGGTYFPPVQRFNLPSFQDVLKKVHQLWREDRSSLIKSGEKITAHLNGINRPKIKSEESNLDILNLAMLKISQSYDWKFGGWGQAPKFPQPIILDFLLRRAAKGDTLALEIATHALTAMSKGGMYDVVGGGFARYSTDNYWLVPHFEKMLYDNALLARVYLHAYLLTGELDFKRICNETLSFIMREMTHPEGGFFSSIDADSEGEEGKYYLWTFHQLKESLQKSDDIDFITSAYGIKSTNFSEHIILQRSLSDEELGDKFGLSIDSVRDRLKFLHNRLYEYREKRVRPGVDNKVIVAWNALAAVTFSEAGRYFDNKIYVDMATRNINFILYSLYIDKRLRRSWRNGKAQYNAYLIDYATLVEALLSLYQTNYDADLFIAAKEFSGHIRNHFKDPHYGFFDTGNLHDPLIMRPKRLQDNPIPSGNSVAVYSLLQLASYTGDYQIHGEFDDIFANVKSDVLSYPLFYGKWLCAIDVKTSPLTEVAILHPPDQHPTDFIKTLWSHYRPNLVAAVSTYPSSPRSPALLKNRSLLDDRTTAYVCQNQVCNLPVNTPQEFSEQLSEL
jgi:uncharacterized protein YyaL (SSP411 family)